MVRANTMDTQGKPGLTGEVGGMYLGTDVKWDEIFGCRTAHFAARSNGV